MTNIFRPVDNDIVLPDRILQGQSWRNISFGANATPVDYGNHGLYLEVGAKPTHDQYQNVELASETINHNTKEIELSWLVQDKTPEQVAEIERKEEIELEQDTSGLKGITATEAKTIINAKFQTVAAMPDGNLAQVQLKIQALIETCAWVDRKEAMFLLK